jgi:hypothetical protein
MPILRLVLISFFITNCTLPESSNSSRTQGTEKITPYYLLEVVKQAAEIDLGCNEVGVNLFDRIDSICAIGCGKRLRYYLSTQNLGPNTTPSTWCMSNETSKRWFDKNCYIVPYVVSHEAPKN